MQVDHCEDKIQHPLQLTGQGRNHLSSQNLILAGGHHLHHMGRHWTLHLLLILEQLHIHLHIPKTVTCVRPQEQLWQRVDKSTAPGNFHILERGPMEMEERKIWETINNNSRLQMHSAMMR